MSGPDVLRVITVILCMVTLGWLIGMTRAYVRLFRATNNPSWVPGAMIYLTVGMALVISGLVWRSVQFFHGPFTAAQVLSLLGLVVLDVGLQRMSQGITNREHARRVRDGREESPG